MFRFCVIFFVIVCMSISVGIAVAQEEAAPTQEGGIIIGATIRGEVIGVSPEQEPIAGATVKILNMATVEEHTVTTDKDGVYEKRGLPAGRYVISVSKAGYGDRVGKSKLVPAGGEIFHRIKMTKKDNIFTFLQRYPLVWLLVVGVIVVIVSAFVVLLLWFY